MKALKRILLAILAFCVTVCVGIFAVACNTDKGDKGEENNKPPVTQPGDGDEDGDDEDKDEDEDEDEDNKADEYTVTLNVGDGALGAGESTSLKTVNGKIVGYLPEPTISKAHWHFDNWYDAEDNAIDEKTFVFEEDTTLYAKYIRDNGVWNGDGTKFIADLKRNIGETTGVQYWLDGSISLEEGDEISLYLGGKLITFNVHASYASSCIENASDTSSKVTSVTVSEDANFKIYLWDYSDDNGEFWSCQFLGVASTIETTSTIPEGCDAINITGTNGTATIYLVINGLAINEENGADFQIHGWQDSQNNIFGAWGSTPTLAGNDDGEIKVDFNLDDDLVLMFYWSGGQSGNIANVKVGESYIVKVNTLRGSTVSVKQYAINGPEDTDDEELHLVLNENYLVGQGFKVDGVDAKFNIQAGFEIGDSITVELTAGSMFKAVICTNVVTGGPNDGDDTIWKYNEASFYKISVAEKYEGQEANFVTFTGGNNVVKAAGTYTITVDKSGESILFVITPADDVEPVEEGDPAVDTRDFFILGSGKSNDLANDWGVNTKLTHTDGTNVYTITLDLYEGDQFQFAINSSWADQQGASALATTEYEDTAYLVNASGNIKCLIEGNYTFTLTTNHVDGTAVITWTYNGAVVDVLEDDDETTPDDSEEEEVVKAYYLIGGMNGWTFAETAESAGDYAFTDDGEGTYSLTVSLVAGNEFKIAVCGNEWNGAFGESALIRGIIGDNGTATSDGDYQLEWTGSDNINVGVTGTYTFTFTPGAGYNQQLTYTFTAESAD